MYKILFVCHGNICRSPMAEFVMKHLTAERGVANQFHIASAATSREEIGRDVHPGARRALAAHGVAAPPRRAVQLTRADYEAYDWLLGMERRNLAGMLRLTGGDPDGKMRRLLDFTDRPRDIEDPWYTGRFEQTYIDVLEGCQALLGAIVEAGKA